MKHLSFILLLLWLSTGTVHAQLSPKSVFLSGTGNGNIQAFQRLSNIPVNLRLNVAGGYMLTNRLSATAHVSASSEFDLGFSFLEDRNTLSFTPGIRLYLRETLPVAVFAGIQSGISYDHLRATFQQGANLLEIEKISWFWLSRLNLGIDYFIGERFSLSASLSGLFFSPISVTSVSSNDDGFILDAQTNIGFTVWLMQK